MAQPRETKLDAGFRLEVTVTLPDGTIYRADRAIDQSSMEQILGGGLENGASMMLETLGQHAVDELRIQLAPGSTHSENVNLSAWPPTRVGRRTFKRVAISDHRCGTSDPEPLQRHEESAHNHPPTEA